ncbi:hypothetical protein LCGC14_0489660 [marine sediment metagenome]|uniref:GIY-YIG domain-containing protein n=1 Tax=marine sediment metagenome TaxID=412755 RepID=A0A0F9UTX3_9ZZZZ
MSEEKPYGIVYVLTSPSGKQYVGQTVKTLKHRLRKHRSLAEGRFQNSAIAGAVRKYGIDAFESCVIAIASSQRELDALEIRHIAEQGTIAPNGYNLLAGGSGGRVHHKDTREKLRKAATGRKASDETRRKMSESNKGDKNGFYGRKHSEETKLKMRVHKRTPEHAAKLGSAKAGTVLTQEHKTKIGEGIRKFWDEKGRSPLNHSTYAGYRKGCKCRPCLDANSSYHKARRERKLAE